LTRSRIYCLTSTPDRKGRLYSRIATATTTLQTLTPLQPVKAAEVAAEAEAHIGVKGKPIRAPELAITAAK
jgi:hypothetical protein